jgi:hypothetical protein
MGVTFAAVTHDLLSKQIRLLSQPLPCSGPPHFCGSNPLRRLVFHPVKPVASLPKLTAVEPDSYLQRIGCLFSDPFLAPQGS